MRRAPERQLPGLPGQGRRALGPGERRARRVGRRAHDHGASAHVASQEPARFQLLVGARHRRPAHAELCRQLALRGEALAHAELPGADAAFDGLDHLAGELAAPGVGPGDGQVVGPGRPRHRLGSFEIYGLGVAVSRTRPMTLIGYCHYAHGTIIW